MISCLRWSKYIILFIVCIGFGSLGRADDRSRDRATLRGIKAIVVRVRTFEADWGKELHQLGLSEDYLQAVIEKQLEAAGITVLPEEAAGKSESEAFLIARLAFLDPEPAVKRFSTADGKIEKTDLKKKYVYTVRLNLRQAVMLERDTTLTPTAITWQTEAIGFNRLSLLQNEVSRAVNVFIEAYSSENASVKTPE